MHSQRAVNECLTSMAKTQQLPPNPGPMLAAKYVRMSTEHQQYSIDNQVEAINRYARDHHMEIVRTYTDSGKSGLSIENRPGLRQLIEDVESGSPGYAAVLVYDVSRWGRFQDVDESAFYEYQCRRAKIALHYCVESFSNDGSAWAALAKALKRTMAAEYSRELSAKVFAGQSRLTELGFRQGGTAGYGLRRLLVDQNGKPKFVLRSGERKSIATDRVVLLPGPQEEIDVVNEIFRLYVTERRGTKEIAKLLNQRGVVGEGRRVWTRYIIRHMVTNPKYIGSNVTNRSSAKLRTRQVQNPPDLWVRRDNAFPAIVDPGIFQQAEREASARSAFLTNEQLLDCLRQVLRKHGRISERLLKSEMAMPCAQVYVARFGGMAEAYRLIGYQPCRDLAWVERDRGLTPIRREFIARIVATLKRLGASVQQDTRGQCLTVNENLNVRICITRCRAFKRFNSWKLQLCSPWAPDVSIFARLTPGNEAILDYFCVPGSSEKRAQITVSPKTPPPHDIQQFTNLEFLQDLAKWRRR
jgi:DNA invertase Pin-like site-specific DNA recombinase